MRDLRQPFQFLREALAKHNPEHIIILWSGGGDSTVTVDVTQRWIEHDEVQVPHKVVSIDTLLTHDHWRDFVESVATKWGLPHQIYENPDPDWYERQVLENGFPYNPNAQHPILFSRLKERAIRVVVREHKDPDNRFSRVLFVSGVRKFESERRKRTLHSPHSRVGSAAFVNPLFWWPDQKTALYRVERELVRNPFKEKTGGSGDCYCIGAGHCTISELRAAGAPRLADRLERLEEKVRPIHGWGYNEKPDALTIKMKLGEQPLPELEIPFLCVGCKRPKPAYDEAMEAQILSRMSWDDDETEEVERPIAVQLSLFGN